MFGLKWPHSNRARGAVMPISGQTAGDWPELRGEPSADIAGRFQPSASLSFAWLLRYFPFQSVYSITIFTINNIYLAEKQQRIEQHKICIALIFNLRTRKVFGH